MEQEKKLLPQTPVLTEYLQVKEEIENRVNKYKDLKVITEDNKKEIKNSIAELNKVKQRIARYRIDNTDAFMEYIKPFVEQCKELENLCDSGTAEIKQLLADYENSEKKQKEETINKLFNFNMECCPFKELLKFEMFFDLKMANKTANLNIVEKELKEWISKRTEELNFINSNCDEPVKVIAIYLKNEFNLTGAIQEYQDQFKTEAQIEAIKAQAVKTVHSSFERKINLKIIINFLPQSKAGALESFLKSLNVDYKVERIN